VQLALAVTAAAAPNPDAADAVTVLALYHVAELVVVAVNMNVFDPVRSGAPVPVVASVERTLVLSVWNFVEIAWCFAIVYSAGAWGELVFAPATTGRRRCPLGPTPITSARSRSC
jgi:hypothetical protein